MQTLQSLTVVMSPTVRARSRALASSAQPAQPSTGAALPEITRSYTPAVTVSTDGS